MDFNIMSDPRLSDEEQHDLQITAMVSGRLYCQNCRSCIPGCLQRVEIPTLMRAFMYARGYRNLEQARSTAEELPGHQGPEACRDCTDCTAVCPHGIDIEHRIKDLHTLLFA